MSTEARIRQALRDLATAPEPGDLAERALQASARRKWLRLGTASAAAVLVVLAGTAVISHLPGGGTRTAAPGSRPASAPCVQYTSGSNDMPDVPRDQWPDILVEVVDALPDRSDYSMQSGSVWCGAAAYIVLNLGVNREAGHLTLNVWLGQPPPGMSRAINVPDDCAQATPAVPLTLLFCDDTADPMTFGVGSDGYSRVTAVYGDGVIVSMESYSPVTADQLRTAVSDPYVYETIPLSASAT